MRDYPPAHVIHEASCPDAPAGLLAFRAQNLRTFPNSRPHSCFSRDTVIRNWEVVAELGDYELHRYAPSTVHHEDATRPLCKICRGTHGTQPVDLRAFLGLRVAG